eukprot:14823934-Ditylum_brightwellii.AAC.2
MACKGTPTSEAVTGRGTWACSPQYRAGVGGAGAPQGGRHRTPTRKVGKATARDMVWEGDDSAVDNYKTRVIPRRTDAWKGTRYGTWGCGYEALTEAW